MSKLPDDITPERLMKMREERGGTWRPTAEYQESLALNAERSKEAADPQGPLYESDGRGKEDFMQPRFSKDITGLTPDEHRVSTPDGEMSMSELPDESLYD